MAAGADVDLHDMLGRLDAELVAPITRTDLPPEQAVLRRSLGVA